MAFQNNTLYISGHGTLIWFLYFKNSELSYIQALKKNNFSTEYIGNIYRATVTSVDKKKRLVFLTYDKKKSGLLSLDENMDLPHEGENLIVQLKQLKKADKQPLFSSKIHLVGQHLIIQPHHYSTIIPKTITKQKQEKLQKLSNQYFDNKIGILFRSFANHSLEDDIKDEYNHLKKIWDQTLEKKNIKGLLYQSSPIDTVYNSCQAVKEYICDIPSLFEDMKTKYPYLEGHFHSEKISLFEKYELEDHIDFIKQLSYQLETGESIHIHPHSTLTSIDVNSGKSTHSSYQANANAAQDIAKQIILRHLSGNIIIDFISLKSAEQRYKISSLLKDILGADNKKCFVSPMSRQGIVEITRPRQQSSLFETLYQSCPTCLGLGQINSFDFICDLIIRQLKQQSLKSKNIYPTLLAHPELIGRLKSLFSNKKEKELIAEYGFIPHFQEDPLIPYDKYDLIV